jgi:hypothetical protein
VVNALAASGPENFAGPPSLRRRAPARIDVALKSGQPLSMTRRRVHLLAGQSFVLQVVPPNPGAKIEIAADPPLRSIVASSPVEGGTLPTYHAEFSGRLPMRIIPVPKTGKLHVTTIDGLPNPWRITIPVTVRPSYSTLVLWWLLAFLGIVGLRWQTTVANGASYPDILDAMRGDVPYLLGLLALGFLTLIPLLVMIGWVVTAAELGEGSD